jgi:precorrin-3B synthase
MIGTHRLPDGSMAVGVALPFGHIHSDALAALAKLADSYGLHSVRLAPGRALLLLGVAPKNAAALAHEAAGRGLIVYPDDPRRRIVACPGKPACASGLIAARTLATELAQSLVLAPGLSGAANSAIPPPCAAQLIHISGCAKGCAHPGAAALTVVGTERGCGIVHAGSARAVPSSHVDPADIIAEIEHIISQAKETADA